jgi:TPR repeat protein
MRQKLQRLVFALALISPLSAHSEDVQATQACDLAAASPYDRARPAGIAGVSIGKIDPKVARPACENALAVAPNNPRLLYQMGRVLDAARDEVQARVFYTKAAEQGYAEAQASLGSYYASGKGGIARNDEKAARLYQLSADQGSSFGQTNLGSFYRDGRGGLEKNDQNALRLYKLAADQGDAYAQANLGRFYENGLGGLPKDEREAARLYKLAAEQGETYSAERLKQLSLMREAQKLVCQSVKDFIIKYGHTIRLRLNTTEKLVWDSDGERFTYRETDTAFNWEGDGLKFNLDRTTLLLEAGGLLGVATYHCQKDQPQL